MAKTVKKGFPRVHYYDQDFVDVYDRTWAWLEDSFQQGTPDNGFGSRYFNWGKTGTINHFEACFGTFFLVYSNRIYPTTPVLDNFYSRQEEKGASQSTSAQPQVRSSWQPSGTGWQL